MLSVDADIVPGQSLGGLHIGDTEAAIVALGPARVVRDLPTIRRYALGAIEVDIVPGTAVVFQLAAIAGYRGACRGIALGTSFDDARRRLPSLYYSDAEGMALINGDPGVCFEFDLDDPLPDEVSHAIITRISVFDPALPLAPYPL